MYPWACEQLGGSLRRVLLAPQLCTRGQVETPTASANHLLQAALPILRRSKLPSWSSIPPAPLGSGGEALRLANWLCRSHRVWNEDG